VPHYDLEVFRVKVAGPFLTGEVTVVHVATALAQRASGPGLFLLLFVVFPADTAEPIAAGVSTHVRHDVLLVLTDMGWRGSS